MMFIKDVINHVKLAHRLEITGNIFAILVQVDIQKMKLAIVIKFVTSIIISIRIMNTIAQIQKIVLKKKVN